MNTTTSISTLPTTWNNASALLLHQDVNKQSSGKENTFPDTSRTNWNPQSLFCRIRRIQKSNNHTHRIFCSRNERQTPRGLEKDDKSQRHLYSWKPKQLVKKLCRNYNIPKPSKMAVLHTSILIVFITKQSGNQKS